MALKALDQRMASKPTAPTARTSAPMATSSSGGASAANEGGGGGDIELESKV